MNKFITPEVFESDLRGIISKVATEMELNEKETKELEFDVLSWLGFEPVEIEGKL